jgi:hypothetical protein
MAKRNYLVEGLSGTGKSSVYEELIRRGYNAISTDRAWAYHADPHTGLPAGSVDHDNWMWDQHNLRIDDDTMRRRLQDRTDDDWPLGQEGVELMLELNRSEERPAGAIDIDATQPLYRVVDDLLRLAD